VPLEAKAPNVLLSVNEAKYAIDEWIFALASDAHQFVLALFKAIPAGETSKH
jgi:hypothetical protein